ncbi:MAG TPA: DUF5106 domain-containing protein [Marinilabiliaceae bacterium]|nr:DUF5106 domain-containing protein [Marinilabiliaceae bacterium]
MNRLRFFLPLIFSLLLSPIFAEGGHEIKVKIKEFGNQDIILAYYFNKSMYVRDTVKADAQGLAVFTGSEPLPGGLYLFYLPNGKFFDVLISEGQNMSISTDTLDLIGNMSISGSEEAGLFLEYQRFIGQQQAKVNSLREEMAANAENQEALDVLNAKFEDLNKEVAAYWENAVTLYPGTFYATFIKAMQEPVIPDFELPEGTQNPDSILQAKRYFYYRDHYFDNIDFQDARLLRTPFFAHKIDNYMERMIVQVPDTVAKTSIDIIEKSRGNEEMFRFLVQLMYNRTNESKIMGMDAAMVALADKYYLAGETPWADEKFLENLRTRVGEIRPTLLGSLARNLKMENEQGQVFSLHEINAAVTILAFYEPSCGHCKKEIPKLYKEVFEKYRNKGVQVFAVYTMADREEWTGFINEHELFDWINVYDPYHQTRFRNFYDIRSTPMIYILDREKKIVAKRLDVEQMPGFLDHLLNKQ